MRIPLPPDLQPTNEMLRLIGSIEEFKGEWRALGSLDPDGIHLPGIYVHRLIQGEHEKRIEQRTTRAA